MLPILVATAATLACNGATFNGATKSRASNGATPEATPTPVGSPTPTPVGSPSPTPVPTATPPPGGPLPPGGPTPTPVPTPTPPPVGPTPTPAPHACTPDQKSVGAQIALLIDNSNSNAATDCPDARQTDTFRGVNIYACGSQTNREAAVLAAYDVLQQVAANQPANALAVSSLAIASFPTRQDYYSSAGWAQQTQGWVPVNAATRAGVASAMLFARQPFGMTPYGAAMSAGMAMFKNAPADGRARVAILITDGNATDRDPAAVSALAAALRQSGVKVISLAYSIQDNASQLADRAMMSDIDRRYQAQGSGHWYTADYATFDAYIAALIGPDGLMQTVSAHDVIQVSDSTALKSALLSVIQNNAIGCTN